MKSKLLKFKNQFSTFSKLIIYYLLKNTFLGRFLGWTTSSLALRSLQVVVCSFGPFEKRRFARVRGDL